MIKKMVNGEDVVMSVEEEAAIRAEWAENAPAQQVAKVETVDDKLAKVGLTVADLKAALAK